MGDRRSNLIAAHSGTPKNQQDWRVSSSERKEREKERGGGCRTVVVGGITQRRGRDGEKCVCVIKRGGKREFMMQCLHLDFSLFFPKQCVWPHLEPFQTSSQMFSKCCG